ncbi:N-acyl homoserine lactonase family protein [Nitratireductor sp. ZSWI3]|uniref:N-acyl homoserine lactonase family protein n=1 Tax=Nitratireductor sp. ZSWI3 TaxID=2966359 RepID=UPI00214FF557|nr:N-acyl homoserine lactonase family protein [Nitratireductor sp. ZSWI3]MCR4265022.1 N-acyl homoserine lactonase family protein [Nitratireductor sp. ZSWI3]
MSNGWEIFAIRYSRLPRKRRENMIFCPPERQDEEMPIDYSFWVLRNEAEVWVVDTGYSTELAAQLGRTFICDPIETLREMGIAPEAVRNVILTHLHYDHAGNLHRFPNARFLLHAAELPFATGWYAKEPTFAFAFNKVHVMQAVELVYDRRVDFVEGDTVVAPGIELYHIPGHSPGHLSVRVHTTRGWVLLAVDAAHFIDNMVERRPYPIYLDLHETLMGYDRLAELCPNPELLIGGHDSSVIERYPSLPGFEGKVAALHLAPGP